MDGANDHTCMPWLNSDESESLPTPALAVSEIALAGGAGVARVHGGGFAGTIQAFVKNEAVSGYRAAMDRLFGADACKVLKIRKYGGMKVLA